ncbi:hypothetical protein RB597_008061 [Gaeumannomyces tritici]
MLVNTVLAAVLLAATGARARVMPFHHPNVAVPQQHFEVLNMRQASRINPRAVSDVKCTDANVRIVFHDQNVAELAICGGIAGSVTKCEGSPSSTTGQSGSAKFSLTPVEEGATINISKGRWEECVRAARGVCPTGSMTGVCSGGASRGDVAFTLANP